MKKSHLSTTFLIFIISVFLTLLLVHPASAVKKARVSQLNGGWQIWIAAVDFDKNEGVQPGKKEKQLADKTQKPWLAEDILVAKVLGGFAEYEFESPQAGKAHIHCRVTDLRAGGGQSWFIVLNSQNIADNGDSLIIDTGNGWSWRGGRDKPESLSPTELKKEKNLIRVQPREAEAAKEIMMDAFVVSTKPFNPTDNDYNKAQEKGFAVEPEDKLATVWGTIKRD